MKKNVKYILFFLLAVAFTQSAFAQGPGFGTSYTSSDLSFNHEVALPFLDLDIDPETNPVSLDLDIMGGLVVGLTESSFNTSSTSTSSADLTTSENPFTYVAALKMGFRKTERFWLGSELTAIYIPGTRPWPFADPECFNCPPQLDVFEELGGLRAENSWVFSSSLWVGQNFGGLQVAALAGIGFQYDPAATFESGRIGLITAAANTSFILNYGLSVSYEVTKNIVLRADSRFITSFPGTTTVRGSFSREAQIGNTYFTSLYPSIGFGIVL